MANAMKNRMNELMAQEIEKNPDIVRGKKMIGNAIIVWLVSRLVFHAVDLMCVAQDFWAFSPSNLIGLIVSVIFVISAYSGVKLFAVLPVIGGFWMLYQCFTSGCFEVLLSDEYYAVIRVYAAAFILASFVQICVFFFILINKKSRAYFDAYNRSNTAVISEKKSL